MTIWDCRTHVRMPSMTSSVERTDLDFKISVALLRSHKGDEAETLHKCLCYYAVHKLCFYCCCECGFIAMATLSFHRFIMGKVKVGLYFYLTYLF